MKQLLQDIAYYSIVLSCAGLIAAALFNYLSEYFGSDDDDICV